MKLYTNGNAVSASEATATRWRELGYSVWVLDVDAEEFAPPKPERWVVADASDDVLLRGGIGFCYCGITEKKKMEGNAMTFPYMEDAERLKSALESGGMTGLRVVKLDEDDEE